MPNAPRAERATCIDDPTLFQHPLLEDPSAARPDAERLRQAALLAARAANACARCPLFDSTPVRSGRDARRGRLRRRNHRSPAPPDPRRPEGHGREGRLRHHRRRRRRQSADRPRRARPASQGQPAGKPGGAGNAARLLALDREAASAPRRGDSEVELAVVRPTMERVLRRPSPPSPARPPADASSASPDAGRACRVPGWVSPSRPRSVGTRRAPDDDGGCRDCYSSTAASTTSESIGCTSPASTASAQWQATRWSGCPSITRRCGTSSSQRVGCR